MPSWKRPRKPKLNHVLRLPRPVGWSGRYAQDPLLFALLVALLLPGAAPARIVSTRRAKVDPRL
jgi:hypothetical protein